MKLLKVTFEYQDHIEWLEGEDADKWLEAGNTMAVMSGVHGNPFPQFKWQTKKKKTSKDNI